MTIDHNITKRNTISIKEELDKIGAKASEINEKKGEVIKDAFYNDFAKAEQTKALDTEFRNYAEGVIRRVEMMLETIRDKEIENENILDVTDEVLAGSLKIVEAMGADLPYETRHNIVDGLKGCNQALIILKAAFEKYEMSTKYINKYIINAEAKYNELINIAKSIPGNSDSSLSSIYLLYRNMFSTAELLGVTFTDSEKRVGFDLDKYQEDLAARVMGVNTSANKTVRGALR